MTKQTLKIWYCDFWNGFNIRTTLIYKALSEHYTVVLDSINPDVLFYSVPMFGQRNKIYKCLKIQISGECPNSSDDNGYTLGYNADSDKNSHMLWQFVNPDDLFCKTINMGNLYNRHFENKVRNFCCFMASNASLTFDYSQNSGIIKRIEAFKAINNYKQVTSCGRVMNNTGWLLAKTVDAMKQLYSTHKFAIAYENTCFPGYLTEKIFIPLAYGCIPIYYGDPKVEEVVNPRCFINANHLTENEIISEIKKIEGNNELYLSMINEPVFNNPSYVKDCCDNNCNFILKLIKNEVLCCNSDI